MNNRNWEKKKKYFQLEEMGRTQGMGADIQGVFRK